MPNQDTTEGARVSIDTTPAPTQSEADTQRSEEFTPLQQARIDALVRAARAEERAEVEAQHATKHANQAKAEAEVNAPDFGLLDKYSTQYKLLAQIFGPTSNPALANQLAMSNKTEYLRLRAIAKRNGLV